MKDSKFKEQNLIGMYFLTFVEGDGNKRFQNQGQITGQFGDYLIGDIFSWMDGRHVLSKLYSLKEVSEFNLFPNKELFEEWQELNPNEH